MARPPGSSWGLSSDTAMDWRVDAACRSHADPDAWIVKKSTLSEENRTALRICATCPVIAQCRAWYDSLDPLMRQSVVAGGVRWSNTGKPVLKGDGGTWTIVCHYCGAGFVAGWAHARYCGRDCYVAARRERLNRAQREKRAERAA